MYECDGLIHVIHLGLREVIGSQRKTIGCIILWILQYVTIKMAALVKVTRCFGRSLKTSHCLKKQTRLASHFPIDDNLYGLSDEQKQVS